MSGIRSFLNQTATLKTPSAYSSASGKTMTTSTIKVRFEPYTRQATDTQGNIYTSEAIVYTESQVRVGDTITFASREWPVRNVRAIPGLDGATDHYEVVL